jgi:hypothetical protein
MTRGTRVVRVSLMSSEGKLGDVGTIERSFGTPDMIIGYNVIWDSDLKNCRYVAPVRVQSLEAWERSQEAMKAGAR